MIFQGKTALVTGGSAGIGKAIAMRFGREGAAVAVCGRSEAKLEVTVRELRTLGIEASPFVCDICDLQAVEDMVAAFTQQQGKIDILVNNVGALGESRLEQRDDDLWHRVLRTNLDGTYYCTSRVLPHMPDGGRVITVSGVLGKRGFPGWAAYCTSKHGLIGFTRALALELAPRRITVNAICPGWVDTDLARGVLEGVAKAQGTSFEEIRSGVLSDVPLGEMLEAEEIAGLVAFLSSAEARNITGQAYNICGGQVMH